MNVSDADLQAVVNADQRQGTMARVEGDFLVSVCRELLEFRAQKARAVQWHMDITKPLVSDTQEMPVVTVEVPEDDPADLRDAHPEAFEWIDAVDASVADGSLEIPPVPVDAICSFIMETGCLDESPALALLDEIARLRRPA